MKKIILNIIGIVLVLLDILLILGLFFPRLFYNANLGLNYPYYLPVLLIFNLVHYFILKKDGNKILATILLIIFSATGLLLATGLVSLFLGLMSSH